MISSKVFRFHLLCIERGAAAPVFPPIAFRISFGENQVVAMSQSIDVSNIRLTIDLVRSEIDLARG